MKTKILQTSLFVIIILGSSQHVCGQTKTKSLQNCIQSAIDNNLTIKSGETAIEMARDMQGSAFNLDRTNISLSQDPTAGGSPENAFSLSQDFEFPTIYFSRKKLLKAETKLERNKLEISRNELIKEVSSTYYQLIYDKEKIDILQKQDSLYSKFLFLANTKLKFGESGKLEQINAERLYNENKIELLKAKKTYENTQITLQRWMNSDDLVEPAQSLAPILKDSLSICDFNPRQTPVEDMFETKKLISKTNLSLSKQDFLPKLSFAIKHQYLLKGFNPYHLEREKFNKGNFMGFEIGLSLPLFFGEQRAKTKALKKEIKMVHMQKEETLNALQKQFSIYKNEYLKAKKSLDYYSLHGIKQAEDMIRISQVSYENGEINYIEYIQNLQMAVEIHLHYANAINDFNQTIIMLNYIQGNKL